MGWHLGGSADDRVEIDGDELTTHGVIVGMTGSGKTGLGVICLEEALLSGVPVLAIDPKGDMGNLALVFPELAAADFEPWVDPAPGEERTHVATATADRWAAGLERAGIDRDRMAALAASEVTVYTPGSTTGTPLSLLGSMAPPIDADAEAVRDEAQALVSSILLLSGIDADPVADPSHVLLANLVESAWVAGETLDLETLIARTLDPPIRKLGVFELDRFISPEDRETLAMRLNAIVASPTASAWREGEPLDLDRMLSPSEDRPAAAVISIAHLDDASRQFVVATVMSKAVSWARRQPGTDRLRLLIYMDEVFGFVPPTANPPSKQPILTLLKQGRAHGVGLLLATQNPMDLDYKAMSNAGTWMIGRLQTERDQARILEGMDAVGGAVDLDDLSTRIAGLDKREFVLHSTRAAEPVQFSTRWAMSFLAGPLSKDGLERLRGPIETSSKTAPDVAEAAADAVAIAPDVAETANPGHARSDAPWLSLVGGDPNGKRLEAAVVARVHLRFDDRYAAVDHAEEWEAVFHPLPKALDPGLGIAVDHDDRDFGDSVPDGATFALPDQPIDEAVYWRDLKTSITNALVAERSVSVWKNADLKLYSRLGESRDDFLARCGDVAAGGADEGLAKLKDRYESKVRTARDRLRTAETRAGTLAIDLQADRQDEMVGGIGDLLGAFAGGRSSSAGLRRMARRRADIDRTQVRLAEAEAAVVARMEAIAAIETDLAADVERITDDWAQKAETIEEVGIGLEKTDVRVTELRLIWLPMATP